ncbi:hypothetical protein [Streptomyces niveus]|uniref:Uncharacterized protein n=1 Tax=Streptomyces niveus TaxID=193462 RepID=A0A1U9R0T3_STRNV|nr:hypothetical protein [Streptomyces niveus]AQU70092.1 hypothetical protein BBN63_31860 [Streptomyces niveus]
MPTTTAAPTASPAGVRAVPNCVHLEQRDYKRGDQWRSLANVKNTCGYTVRLRMIWRGTTDGRCVSLHDKREHGESKPGTGPYVSELRDC